MQHDAAVLADRTVTTDLLDTLRAILGADGVVADAAAVERVTRTCMPFRTLPSAVVYPKTVQQV